MLRQLRYMWDEMTPAARIEMFDNMTDKERSVIAESWEFIARPNQLSPISLGYAHMFWIILSGRGFGKTRTGAETALDHIAAQGASARVALVGCTAADVRDTMIEGESGMLACADRRHIEYEYEPSKRRITFRNGGIATSYSGEVPDRLRGAQHTFAWCDELSSWQYDIETWDMMMFGLRLGKTPAVIVTTTPKPRKLMKMLLKDKRSFVTCGSTFDNKDNLAPTFIAAVKARYEGTRLGRQELHGELLEDTPGALWWSAIIDDSRRPVVGGNHIQDTYLRYDITRVVVAVDPAVTSGDNSDETGIVVAGEGADGHFYVFKDYTGKYTPNEWGSKAIQAYHTWQADRVVAEVNQGGDMVENTLRTIDPAVSYKAVRAVRGKRVRAEPIAALYEQGKVHHVGLFPEMEEQMCSYTPDNYCGSPDRLDALVWALTELSSAGGSGIFFV